MKNKTIIFTIVIIAAILAVLGFGIYNAIISNNYIIIFIALIPCVFGGFLIARMIENYREQKAKILSEQDKILGNYSEIIGNAFIDDNNKREELLSMVVYFNNRKNKKAISQGKGLLRKCKSNEEKACVLFFIACSYANNHEIDKAIDTYKKLFEINDSFDRAWSNYGLLLSSKGKNKEAGECYIKAIAINPNNSFAYNNYACLCYNEKKYNKAIEYAEKAISLNNNYYSPYEVLSLSFYAKGDKNNAKTYCSKAIELGHPKPDALKALLNPKQKFNEIK